MIKKKEEDNNNNHKNKSSKSNHHRHQQYQHNNALLSQISVSILFAAALAGTTGGTIALAPMVGEISLILFPSAEATPIVYQCDGLIATIVGNLTEMMLYRVH
jgi:hypothetical protein